MADVRSMLRTERAARRITHPHASYTGDGKLLCNLCGALVKSETQWQSHLHSTQHTLRSQRVQEAKESRGAEPPGQSKKRKAEELDVDSPAAVDKKRVRSGEEDDVEVAPVKRQEVDESNDDEITDQSATDIPEPVADAPPSDDPEAPADEEEMAAFDRELARLEAELRAQPTSALDTTATISAAPMTAEQLAAQAREEASTQRGKRDQELEEEREDAVRVLEEEFEEMEGLEERVRKLREKREALRRSSEAADPGAIPTEPGNPTAKAPEENSDDDYDEEDDWKFGGS